MFYTNADIINKFSNTDVNKNGLNIKDVTIELLKKKMSMNDLFGEWSFFNLSKDDYIAAKVKPRLGYDNDLVNVFKRDTEYITLIKKSEKRKFADITDTSIIEFKCVWEYK